MQLSLYGADDFANRPCLIYVHGFKGFKDWGFVPYAADYFAMRGFSFLTFNFSHNGIGKDPKQFTELDKFARNTYSRELAELREIIHLVAHSDFLGEYLRHPLGLVGHSRGGGLALLAAASMPEIGAVCTWSAISGVDRYSKEVYEAWRKKGHHEVLNSRTGQVMRLGLPLLDDIERHAHNSLDILAATRKLRKPLLIIHGQKDETVPYYEAEQLNIFADPVSTQFRVVPQAGHTYGAVHPFAGTTPALEQVLEMTLDFARQHLAGT
ncbi:MAG: hypothetical protein OHK0039_42880 [Bacteroidia bacterium]